MILNTDLDNLIKEIVDRNFNITFDFEMEFNRSNSIKITFYYFSHNQFKADRCVIKNINDVIDEIRYYFVRLPLDGHWIS